jgi:hypothetical protein
LKCAHSKYNVVIVSLLARHCDHEYDIIKSKPTHVLSWVETSAFIALLLGPIVGVALKIRETRYEIRLVEHSLILVD